MGMIPSKEAMQDALEARHGKNLQKRFSAATVAICGLGGLGSNIAVYLARAGVGKLILIDFDTVDVTILTVSNIKRRKSEPIKRMRWQKVSKRLRLIFR